MINETQRKAINVDKPNLIPLWTFKQNDDAVLNISLFKESVMFDVTGQTIRLGAKTSNGLKEQIDGFTIQGNNIDIALKNTILVPGIVEIDLEFTDAEGKMTSASFFINVNKKVLNDTAVEATNEFGTFKKTVEEIQGDYKGLKAIIIDENNAANLQNQVNEVNASLEQGGNEIQIERKRQYKNIRKGNYLSALNRYEFPIGFSLYNDKLPLVFTNNEGEFITDFDISNYKNTGGKNIYVNTVTGLASNDGLTINTPCQHMIKALTLANDGDTIIFTNDEGDVVYRPSWSTNAIITKSVNITSINKIIVAKADKPTWSKVDGYNSVYEVTRNSILAVIDANNINLPIKYIEVSSIEEVENNPYSWYSDGVKTYVNCHYKLPNEKILPILNTGQSLLTLNNDKDCKVYIENLNFIGGDNCIKISPAMKINHELYLKKCNCYYATNGDVILIGNIKRGYFQNINCAYGVKDGFNYTSGVDFIEINCNGFANGDGSRNTDNGSTAHNDCRGIRINCNYYDNIGGQLIDVINAKSVNLGCIAYNSKSTHTEMSQGMGCQGQGSETEMWFDGCISFGNKYDFVCYKESAININKCQYDTIRKDSGSNVMADERL